MPVCDYADREYLTQPGAWFLPDRDSLDWLALWITIQVEVAWREGL